MNESADGTAARRYPRFDPMGDGGLIDRFTARTDAEIKRWFESKMALWGSRISDFEVVEVPQPQGWPLPGWGTLFAPARPSRRAILDWLIAWEGDAESEGILDKLSAELKNRPPAEHLKKVAGNCKDFTSDLQLLVNAYDQDCPALGGIDLPVGDFVSVDAARQVLRRFRARLSQEIATAERVDGGTLPTAPPAVPALVDSTHAVVSPPSSGPKENEEVKPDGALVPYCDGRLLCSPDFGTVRRGEDRFTFTGNPRAVVEYMVKAYHAGPRTFTQRELLDACESTAQFISDVMKRCHAWGKLVVPVTGQKGAYELRLD